ncbi:hypothetical protein ACLK1Y_14425 [Escherichia coli]
MCWLCAHARADAVYIAGLAAAPALHLSLALLASRVFMTFFGVVIALILSFTLTTVLVGFFAKEKL